MASPSSAATLDKEALPTPKKRSAFSILLAALFSSSNDDDIDSSEKKKAAAAKAVDDKPSIWANLICGIRPLHHPQFDDDEEVVVIPRPAARPMPLPLKLHSVHEVVHPLPPPSPGYVSVDDGMSSRYASTEDLQALDTGNEEVDDDDDGHDEAEKGCEEKGDNAIDMKAEEFIAKFYEQMRLQRVDSVGLSS